MCSGQKEYAGTSAAAGAVAVGEISSVSAGCAAIIAGTVTDRVAVDIS